MRIKASQNRGIDGKMSNNKIYEKWKERVKKTHRE